MNKLYFVACYNHRLNDWVRYLVTAESREDAIAQCEDDGFKAKRVEYICETPDVVAQEV